MRTSGEPAFPDPASNGTISTSQVRTSAQQELLTQFLKFSACMRAHGIPKFPDPTDRNGNVGIHGAGGVGRGSPILKAAGRACRSLEPGSPS